MNRYHRQTILPQIGEAGQSRLGAARVLLVGCGALGTTIAEQLVRAGVGFLRIVDRDLVEMTNLQRQVLFDEADVADGAPKAIAAARRLWKINSAVSVEPVVEDVHAGNIEALAGLDGVKGTARVDLIVDGTDNVETRYLLNDVAVKDGVPWIYGACVGVEGRAMVIRPGKTPCLRCIYPKPPSPGELPTCDTAGVLGPAAAVVASTQAAMALQLLSSATGDVPNQLMRFDLWRGRFGSTPLDEARRSDCITCAKRQFDFLHAPAGTGSSTSLCGRNAVQVRPAIAVRLDLPSLAARLKSAGDVQQTPHLLKCALSSEAALSLTIFPDGRTIVHGTSDPAKARSTYARWIGA